MTEINFTFSDINEKNKIFVANETALLKGNKRSSVISNGQNILKITVSGDSDLVNSKKIYNKSIELFFNILVPTLKVFSERFVSQSHSIRSIQANMKQKIEGLLGNDMLLSHANFSEKRDYAISKINENPEMAADTVIFLQKRIFELEAHMASFELIHLESNLPLEIKSHNLPKVIHNVFSSFEEKFNDIGVHFHFAFDQTVGKTLFVDFDYKTINTALYNLLDNAYKYIKPSSEIRIFAIQNKKVIFSMRSLRIEKEELEKVFELYYRGFNSKHTEGTGVGMFVIKKALNINSMSIAIEPDWSDVENYDGKQYVMNKFIISLPE